MIVSLQLSCQILSWCDGGACWRHAGMSVSTSLSSLLSLSLSPFCRTDLSVLLTLFPHLSVPAPPSILSFVLSLTLSLFLLPSLSFDLPPHFYLCSSAFKFKLIWWWSRWKHVGMSVFPLTSSHLSVCLSLSLSLHLPPPQCLILSDLYHHLYLCSSVVKF